LGWVSLVSSVHLPISVGEKCWHTYQKRSRLSRGCTQTFIPKTSLKECGLVLSIHLLHAISSTSFCMWVGHGALLRHDLCYPAAPILATNPVKSCYNSVSPTGVGRVLENRTQTLRSSRWFLGFMKSARQIHRFWCL
jgi:hypothetical protein